jgi:hypothetical protein
MSRMSSRCRITMVLSVLLLGLSGCRGLKLFTTTDDVKTETVSRDGKTTVAIVKPSRYSFRIAPYVFLSDFEVKKDLPLFRELAGLRDQVYRELQLPSSDRPVLVYLFEDRERYEAYMKARYPELPRRRAFFVAQPRAMGGEDLLVFTYWGDRIQQDLRHELTHGLLHSVLKGVPLWLDEGLAEYFELPPEKKHINDSHLNYIRRSTAEPFRPSLTRLEGLDQVKDMTPAEYRESWAWVHYFLQGNADARTALLGYLQQLKSNPQPGALRPRLAQVIASPEEELSRHVAGLDF